MNPKSPRYFEQEFKSLEDQILEMGSTVERSIDCALNGVILREPSRFNEVYAYEKLVNQFHIDVDNACMKVLAKQSPLATDLRFVLSCIKINADLERMGDQAVNIAHAGREYLEEAALKPLADLPKMGTAVLSMTRDVLDAFLRQDQAQARAVLAQDDVVDAYKRSIFDELIETMKKDPSTVDPAMDLILISRNLERIGDHATNIAEDVIFVCSGIDIRHGHNRSHASSESKATGTGARKSGSH